MKKVEHSKNFEKIKAHYDNGDWNKSMVYDVVGKKYGITAGEYEEITGEKYVAD